MNSDSFFRLHIRKEALKFSAAHMTVFPNGTKEALHGHNYRTELTVEFASQQAEHLVTFSEFKRAMKTLCQQWDEKVLIAEKNKNLKILKKSPEELEFILCGKRYVLPSDEVEMLPLDNIVTESLAFEFSRRLIDLLDPKLVQEKITKLEVKIEEISGQGATYVWSPR